MADLLERSDLMRIATRLVLVLSAAVAAVLLAYGVVEQREHTALLREALSRETDALALTLQSTTANALQEDRLGHLDRELDAVLGDRDTFAALVLGPAGELLAGGVKGDLACLEPAFPTEPGPPQVIQGWAECNGGVRWARLPLAPPAAALLLARRTVLLDQETASSRRRILLLTVALTATIALLILLVLRRTLSAPLGEILGGIRSLGRPGHAPVEVPAATGELRTLAEAVNRIGEQLEVRRHALARETEERLALDRRLHEAETFAVAGRLTGTLVHEIGSPLAVIAMHADAIAAHPEASEDLRAQAGDILTELNRIVELVDGLRRVARRTELEFAPLDLGEVVRAAFEDIEIRTRVAHVEVALRLPGWPVRVRGHRTLLRHAVFNLVNNAVQALSNHPGERRMWVALEREADAVRVVVEDTGPGIPPEFLERVFEPFFTTKLPEAGTGLGLIICRSIAEEHGGTLRLEPRDGAGTRAILTIPADAPPNPPSP